MPTPDAQMNSRLRAVLERAGEISTLPATVTRVIEAAQDPEFSAGDLSRVIESDPALSARILRCVNSVAHGLRHRIDNLQYAVSYMGFHRVRNLAISASVCRIFRQNHRAGTYDRLQLWRHMVGVAVTARMIALRQRMDNFEEAFLAGLLHDLGLILEDQHDHAAFTKLMVHFPEGKSLVDAERAALGYDHATLGYLIAEQWNLPRVVSETILLHHSGGNYEGPNGGIRASVELANALCTLQGISSIGMKLLKLHPGVMARLDLVPEDLRILAEDMAHELGVHEELVRLAAA